MSFEKNKKIVKLKLKKKKKNKIVKLKNSLNQKINK